MGQSVGGSAESERRLAQAFRPKRMRTESSVVTEARPPTHQVRPATAYGCDVSAVGRRVLGSHVDLGKSSVCLRHVEEGAARVGNVMARARDMGAAGTVKEPIRQEKDGRGNRTSAETSCNHRERRAAG